MLSSLAARSMFCIHKQPSTRNFSGSDFAVVGDGIEARTALDLCRQLLAAGANPDAAFICYRGDQVALRIRSVGEGAKLTIREDGLRVVAWRAFSERDVSPPMRQNNEVVS